MTLLNKLCGCLCALVFVCACSTKKNTFVSRNYHTLTSYYNVYWNGREASKEARELLDQQELDNYYTILPVYQFGTVTDTQATSEKSNRMAEKAMLTVKKHSISIRGIEYVRYIDDAYLLLGKSFFYKHDFSKARMIFNFIVSEYPKNQEKYDAMIWIARTYIEEKEFDMAISTLTKVEGQGKALNSSLYLEMLLCFADYHIAQEQYNNALPYLREALPLIKAKDLKSRINFILGQIEQLNGNLSSAFNYYEACLKKNPPLVMAFNTRLNMALCYDKQNVNSTDIKKGLIKMLKDTKNERNFGRIYLVLAEIAFVDNNEDLAIEYLQKAIEVSAQDPERMLLASLRLAEFFYDRTEFLSSQKYYQITASVIEKTHPAYYDVQNRSRNLNLLLENFGALQNADSLLNIIYMNPAEKDIYATELAKNYKKQLEEAKKTAMQPSAVNISTIRSNWYFYNSESRTLGYNDFVKKWGRRPLEDFWFLSNKPPMAMLRNPTGNQMNQEDKEQEKEIAKELNPENKEYYLAAMMPLDSQKQNLLQTVESSLFKLGSIYFEKLSEYALGEDAYLRLLKEFPQTSLKAPIYEALCLLYKQSGNNSGFSKYAKLLAQEFPDSEQDQRINDPLYAEKLKAGEKKVELLYNSVYDYYDRGDYPRALDVIQKIETEYPIHNFKAPLAYIKAICEGQLNGLPTIIPSLELFLQLYSDHVLIERVTGLLKLIKSGNTTQISTSDSTPQSKTKEDANLEVEEKVDENAPKYNYKPKMPHFVIALIPKTNINIEVVKIKTNDFNRKFFGEKKLRLNVSSFDDKYWQMEVSEFKNAENATEYYDSYISNEYVWGVIEKPERIVFPISVENYTLFDSSKSINAYMQFFKMRYLKK